jgi:hypothetical protein
LTQLAPLVGLGLTSTGRAADLRVFRFGAAPDAGREAGSQYALHVQCAWRIQGREGIITGQNDLWEPADAEEAMDWESWSYDTHPNLQDRRMHQWMAVAHVVATVDADDVGGVTLAFARGYRLVFFPSGSRGECWRLLHPSSGDPHFVVGPEAGLPRHR